MPATLKRFTTYALTTVLLREVLCDPDAFSGPFTRPVRTIEFTKLLLRLRLILPGFKRVSAVPFITRWPLCGKGVVLAKSLCACRLFAICFTPLLERTCEDFSPQGRGKIIAVKRRVERHIVIQPSDPNYRIIPLARGMNCVVSTRHYEFLSQFNWHAHWSSKKHTFYAVRRLIVDGKRKRILMHKEILNACDSSEIDHHNGDGLDNRDDNLRPCTTSQNQANRPKPSHNTVGYKGVRRFRNKYRASLIVKGKQIVSTLVSTSEEAARLYDGLAIQYFGEFAHLNFPCTPLEAP
jgi:hypothetical protein